MSLARRVGPLEVPAASWIVARAFSRGRALAGLGLVGAASVVLIGVLRGGAFIDPDRTGVALVQPRSALRTVGALVVLVLAGAVLAAVVGALVALLAGVLPALLLLLVLLLLVAVSAACFAVSLAAGLQSSGTPRRLPGSLRTQLGLRPGARLREVAAVAQLPGTDTRAALAVAREVVAMRLRPGDVVVAQAGTPRLRHGYLRLGFDPGPGDLLVHRR